jgi:hypothetical protein
VLYRFGADLVVVAHLLFIVFAVIGGLAVLRWHWLAFVHLPVVVWATVVELMGWVCPLTPLEIALRVAAGEAGYHGGFVEHYILPIVYPAGLTREIQWLLAALVVLVNAVIYGWLMIRSGPAALRRVRRRVDTIAAKAAKPTRRR